jgi:alpha-beta hydrolase superfamily lysophospholipase
MRFISELRHPTTWYFKVAIATLAFLLFSLLAAAAISAYLIYKMVSPAQSHSQIDLQTFPGHPEALSYNVPGEGPRDGWFFPGLKSAPTIMLCPAYQSSRGELVTLASALQEQQYNVFLFDFSAQGTSVGRSTLGFQEVIELRMAINAVANRGDVDANRFGVWGVNLGGYVALAEAEGDPRVRAVAVESPYAHPKVMVASLVAQSGANSLPMVPRILQWEFDLLNSQYRNVPPVTARIAKLAGVAQLYLESPDDPILSASTSGIFQASPPPHELVVLPNGNYGGMLDDDKRNYENRIVSFFLLNLPATGSR